MKYMWNGKIDPDIEDTLSEISNVGVGLASVALGKMLGSCIAVGIPEVFPIAENIGSMFKDNIEKIAVGILMSLDCEITGAVLFVIDDLFLSEMVQKLISREFRIRETIEDQEALSAIQEIGNILAASYLKAMGTYTGMRIFLSPVMVGVDMIGSLISYPAALLGITDSETVCVNTSFYLMDDSEKKTIGCVMMFPDENSLERIIDALNR